MFVEGKEKKFQKAFIEVIRNILIGFKMDYILQVLQGV